MYSSSPAERDITKDRLDEARRKGVVAWDIETTGLDWRDDRIGTCQLYIPGTEAMIVRLGSGVPPNLVKLLADESVTKLFHHALFDLRFMAYAWDVSPVNIACTKVAAKILHGNDPSASTSLRNLLRLYLGIELDKSQQVSDWTAATLTEEQLVYAAADVIHLPDLFDHLEAALQRDERLDLARACCAHIPARLKLDLLGLPDVYTH